MFKKTFKIAVALSIVFTLSFFVSYSNKNQKAQVPAGVPAVFFSIFNTNETVLQAQTILADLGFYYGNLSGIFGFKTKDAILAYQNSVGIPETGILDIETQEKLFGANIQIEYSLVDNTDYGNNFLYEYIYLKYNSNTDLVEVKGLLLDQIDEVDIGGSFEIIQNTLVTENNEEYKIKNISKNSLENFVGKNVRMFGYFLKDGNDRKREVFLINYVEEDPLNDRFPLISYTLKENKNLSDWIEGTYNESGEYVDIPGHFISLEDSTVYARGGYPSSVALVGYDQVYVIENISDFNMEKLLSEPFTVRGFLLERENKMGYKTIVVNYLE